MEVDKMCSINEVFEMLNWNNSEEIQQKGIEEASKIKYISILFQPVENKGIWENCARVIAQKSDEVLSTYMSMLFEWLKDANWPGFFVIYNRIKKMKPDNIYPDYSYCIAMAKKQNDESWLDFMSGLIENPQIYEKLSKEDQELMSKHYKNFWQK